VHVTEHCPTCSDDASVTTSTGPKQNFNMTYHGHNLELPPCVAQSELPADLKLSDNSKNKASDTSGINVHKEQDCKYESDGDKFSTSAHKDVVTSTDQTDASSIDENPSQCSTSVTEGSHKEVVKFDLTVNGDVKSSSPILCEGTINGC